MSNSTEKWTVWVGGSEVNDFYLSHDEALSISQEWKDNGYEDVVIEQIA